jgi:hypothetical protein
VGDEAEVGLGDFDGVAEGAVVADAEVFDAGALLLGALEVGEPGFVAGGEGAEAVELGVVAVADDAAVLGVNGRFVGEGGVG